MSWTQGRKAPPTKNLLARFLPSLEGFPRRRRIIGRAQVGQATSRPLKPVAAGTPAHGAPISPSIVSGLVALTDASAVFATGLVIYLLYPGWSGGNYQIYTSVVTLNTFLTLSAFHFANMHSFDAVTQP